MRILYGINSQGHGHFSKAAVLVPLLEARGHEVRVISSGPVPPSGYSFTWHRHFHGLPYIVAEGRTCYSQTFRNWMRDLPKLFGSLWRVRRIVRCFEPDLILTDFEPLTASPLIEARCEIVAVSRQIALFDPSVPLPEGLALERKLTRTAIRLFTCGADRRYGYHYEPSSFRCLPPIIRSEISRLRPETGDHIVVYSHHSSTEDLVAWANSNCQQVRAYGFQGTPRGREGRVLFQPPGRQQLLEDLRTARGVITNAGLTTPLEAFLLRKPVCVVPIPGQWEQVVNAFHLERAGIACRSDTWDYRRLLDTPPVPADHPLQEWLSTSPEQVLDRLVHDDRPATGNAALPRRAA